MDAYVAMAQEYWGKWDALVSDAVFGVFETVFQTDIRSQPCPHTVDLPAVRTPTVLVTWAILYLVIVGVGLLTITPADKTKKVRCKQTLAGRRHCRHGRRAGASRHAEEGSAAWLPSFRRAISATQRNRASSREVSFSQCA